MGQITINMGRYRPLWKSKEFVFKFIQKKDNIVPDDIYIYNITTYQCIILNIDN